jgi:flagellar basal-body rod modification protein FlgD
MDTSSIFASPATSNVNASFTGAAEKTMGKEDFLKLLMAQLAHQDPLNPMENSEFVSQLSQFSSLEQLMGVNDNLGLIQVGQVGMTNGQVAGLIGKEVEANGSTLTLTQQGPASINFDLGGVAKEVEVRIRDANGNLVRTLKLGERAAGLNTVTWDGRDSMGNQVQPGSYSLEIQAKDASGAELAASTRIKGTVTGVTYQGGVPLLEIGSATVRVGDVIAIRSPPATTTTTTN